MNICLQCNQETHNPKFCNNSCAASYNNKGQTRKLKTKIFNCISCGDKIEKDIRADSKRVKCFTCKKKRRCYVCGQTDKHVNYNLCRRSALFKSLIDNFGFDESKLGTPEAIEEFYKIRNYVHNLYYEHEMSIYELTSFFNYHGSPWNFTKKLQSLGIKTRGPKESKELSIKNGKAYMPYNYTFKCGWHLSWDNRWIFYRSSYELYFAESLDEQKVYYEVESLKIKYYDTQKQKMRYAIPDFYIPNDNLIIEIKSEYTLNIKNMYDKYLEYKNLGYKFKLICDKKDLMW